jgi:anti-sigma regulatory factor (Ser/Thr protein kinase)
VTEGSIEAVPPAAQTMTYAEPGDVAAVRSFVRAAAEERGLAPIRVEMLVLAVSELTSNTLQHTTGGGVVRLWSDDHHVVCEVADRGMVRSFGQMPPADSPRGRGLAIVQRVVDEVSTATGPDGTVVRIRMDR